jgi:cytochrome P450
VLSRYADIAAALRNHSDFSSAEGVLDRRFSVRTMLTTDPPDHTLLRSLVGQAFTPRVVAKMEARVREIAAGLLDEAMAASDFDLVRDFAAPLPLITIADMLGVEPERRADLDRWSGALIGARSGHDGEGRHGQDEWTLLDFFTYFGETIEARRRERRDDLISALVAAQEDRAVLSTEDIFLFCILLLVAGNETTTNLIANAALALTEHPEQMALVRADPALIPDMIEEVLRYDAPVPGLFRTATGAVEVAGTTIPAGARVLLLFASANRDEKEYPDAGRFDITRPPKSHLAFGSGVHFCLGAPLARLEARVAWEQLLRRTRDLRPHPDRPAVRVESFHIRGLRSFPVLFDPV